MSLDQKHPDYAKHVLITKGDGKVTASNLYIFTTRKERRGYFICDSEGNPLEPQVINENISEPSVPEITTQPMPDLQTSDVEISTQATPELEVKEPEIEVKVDESAVPEDLVCPHCEAKARSESSYLKNHGDNCSMKV